MNVVNSYVGNNFFRKSVLDFVANEIASKATSLEDAVRIATNEIGNLTSFRAGLGGSHAWVSIRDDDGVWHRVILVTESVRSVKIGDECADRFFADARSYDGTPVRLVIGAPSLGAAGSLAEALGFTLTRLS